MKATDFERNRCKLGTHRISYPRLQREFRCADCGGRLGVKWHGPYPGWYISCGRCDSMDFIHERALARQQHEAAEVLDGLPAELKEALK